MPRYEVRLLKNPGAADAGRPLKVHTWDSPLGWGPRHAVGDFLQSESRELDLVDDGDMLIVVGLTDGSLWYTRVKVVEEEVEVTRVETRRVVRRA